MNGLPCPYCGAKTVLTYGRQLYPGHTMLADKHFWACWPCGAWVGCHTGTITPLGRLADRELRAAKQAAHRAFDPIWKSGALSRTRAYAWLAGRMGLTRKECHIAFFDLDHTKRAEDECSRFPWEHHPVKRTDNT